MYAARASDALSESASCGVIGEPPASVVASTKFTLIFKAHFKSRGSDGKF